MMNIFIYLVLFIIGSREILSNSYELVYPKVCARSDRVRRSSDLNSNNSTSDNTTLTLLGLRDWVLNYEQLPNTLHENFSITWVGDTVQKQYVKPKCLFLVGHVVGVVSRSALTVCNHHYVGFIQLNSETFIIQPLNESTNAHLLSGKTTTNTTRRKRNLGSVCFTTEFSNLSADVESFDTDHLIEFDDGEVQRNGTHDDEFPHKENTLNKWRREDIDDEIGYFYDSAWETNVFRSKLPLQCLVQSVTPTTHSYTVQPLISAEGKLMSPVFFVLKEQGGKFGPVVEANLFRAVNVYVTASKSGKLTSEKTQGKIFGPRRWLEIAIGIDYSVINFHGKNKVQHYVLALMNIVNAIYQDPTLDSNLQLVLTRMVLYEHRKHGQVREGLARKSLENVNAWNKKLHFTLLPGEPRHDAAIWLTRIDLGGPSGYAPVSGACDPSRSCTLNRDEGLTSAFIIAHELAHILGLSHDGDQKAGNSCGQEASDGSIMAAMVATTFNKFTWSTCSRREFHRRTPQWTCLLNPPRGLGEVVLKSTLHTTFTMDEQCRMEFGNGYKFCEGLRAIEPCSHLWCSHKDTPFICKTKKGPPLEGTECGTGKWCMNGYCELVDKYKYSLEPVLHNPQDGGWTNWTDWGPCSRTCGFGVQFRSRECNKPRPAYGGKNCKGSTEEFQICGHKKCESPFLDLRAEQCVMLPRILNNNDTTKINMTWLPYESEKSELKCRLTCISRQNGQMFLSKEALLDGTPCSYDKATDICIQGACHRLGCDGKLNSTLEPDACGVCSGNNETCKNVTTIFQRNLKREISRVAVLPRSATNIMITCNITTIRKLGLDNSVSLMLRDRLLGIRYNLSFPEGKSESVSITKGTKFYYSKENNILKLRGRGPLLEELVVLLYAKANIVNSGIGMSVLISYVLPKENPSMEKSRYEWALGGWGPCSMSCGGGNRQRTIACRDMISRRIVHRRHCSLTEKPTIHSEECNTFSCKFHWIPGEWEHCTATCGSNGIQHRELYCVHYSVNGNNSKGSTQAWRDAVNPDKCLKDHPETERTCNRVACLAHWEPTPWSECSASCGVGYKSREHLCSVPSNETLYQCGPKPPSQRRTCRMYTPRTSRLCKRHKNRTRICVDDESPNCQLIDYLGRYCVLHKFQKVCCKTCRILKLSSHQ